MSYVAEAYIQGRSEDIALQPVSISYDQLDEISEYASYATGTEKKPEGLDWFIGFVKAQGARHYGKIYVRFPPAVSMRQFLGPPEGPVAADRDMRRLALSKMAFEVAWRINQATPVSAPALVTSVLLAVRGLALTLSQMHHSLVPVLAYMEDRGVPVTGSAAALRSVEGVRAALDALSSGGPVTVVSDGREPVWSIEPSNQVAAAFYRNSLVHFALEKAICELAVLAAADASAPEQNERVDAFWDHVFRLRDLLKFEFYFAERDEFRAQIAAEMARHDPEWEQHLAGGRDDVMNLLAGMYPLVSQVVLRPFLEAYAIVADVLIDEELPVDEQAVVRRALGVGRQYVAQQRVRSSEPVSTFLFGTALQLADNQGLLDPADTDPDRRRAFRDELGEILRRLEVIDRIALRQFRAQAGL
jgi:glycerol-3-phosphate O-acyltransferase